MTLLISEGDLIVVVSKLSVYIFFDFARFPNPVRKMGRFKKEQKFSAKSKKIIIRAYPISTLPDAAK